MTQKELDRYLRQHGWHPSNGHGSHINYRAPNQPKILTIKRRGDNYQVPDGVIADYRRKTGLPL